jgi:hypothetical protein
MKRIILLVPMLLMLVAFTPLTAQKASADSVSAIMITVGSAVAISNSLDAANGTLPVTLTVTPAIGASDATSTNEIRIRANTTGWMLAAYQSAVFANGGSNLAATDIMLAYVVGTPGATGNSGAGTVTFAGTTLNNLGTSAGAATAIVGGTAKTAMSASGNSSNLTNYFAVDSTVSVYQDFFFTPGTATGEITYVLSAT